MDTQKLQTLIDSLHLEDGLTLDELPDIDLYMDQLITLCDSQLASYRRHPEDKLLTKTMINNYSKKKLLTTVHKKKYSKYQILLIYLIFQLKQVTSIDDIGVMLSAFTPEDAINTDYLTQFYEAYHRIHCDNAQKFSQKVTALFQKEKEESANPDLDQADSLMTALLLFDQSLNYKRLAEKIIDTCLSGD